jgi:hypothetical protein
LESALESQISNLAHGANPARKVGDTVSGERVVSATEYQLIAGYLLSAASNLTAAAQLLERAQGGSDPARDSEDQNDKQDHDEDPDQKPAAGIARFTSTAPFRPSS